MPRVLKQIIRVAVLTAVLSGIACFVAWDYHRVNSDFQELKGLLRDVWLRAVRQHEVLVARFSDKVVLVVDNGTGAVIRSLRIPTLDRVNYDTTLGENMIVFYDRGTGKYNKRIHGGDIRLKSWLGFRKNIVVRCTGLAMEGVYPDDGMVGG
jgi:hypothetical protein